MIGEVYKINRELNIGVKLSRNNVIKITGKARLIDEEGFIFKIIECDRSHLINIDDFIITKDQLLYVSSKIETNHIKKVN